jgi:hypothetical protein
VRGFFIKRFGIDDKTCVVAQILFTGYLICQIGGVTYGTGRHLSDLTYANAETALKVCWEFPTKFRVQYKIYCGLTVRSCFAGTVDREEARGFTLRHEAMHAPAQGRSN